jgi:hypothetical protein
MGVTFTTFALLVLAACSSGPEGAGTEASAAGPTVTALSPDSGPVGTRLVLNGSGFASKGNTVRVGDGYIRDLESPDGTTLAFEVPEGLDRCAPGSTSPCQGSFARVKPGRYEVAVWTSGGSSEPRIFTVTSN